MHSIAFGAFAAAVAAITVASGHAGAQSYGGWDHEDHGPVLDHWNGGPDWDQGPRVGTWDFGRRIDWIQHRIDRGRQDGSLDPGEAGSTQSRLDDIRTMMGRSRVSDGGVLTPHDRDALYGLLNRLISDIHWVRANDERPPWEGTANIGLLP